MPSTTPPMRSDARRNYAALLEAARQIITRDGVNFVFEDIAVSAGVGKGTLYRHFPTRDHLLAALLATEFERLSSAGDALVELDGDPWNAYVTWLRMFDAMPEAYRGLQAHLVTALQDDASVIAEACTPMKRAFSVLLQRAQTGAGVRKDLRGPDLLAVVAALPSGLRVAGEPHPYLSVIIEGTRH